MIGNRPMTIKSYWLNRVCSWTNSCKKLGAVVIGNRPMTIKSFWLNSLIMCDNGPIALRSLVLQ